MATATTSLGSPKEQFTCTICLEEGDDTPQNLDKVKLTCNHVFHKTCLGQSISNYNIFCPNCREHILEGFARQIIDEAALLPQKATDQLQEAGNQIDPKDLKALAQHRQRLHTEAAAIRAQQAPVGVGLQGGVAAQQPTRKQMLIAAIKRNKKLVVNVVVLLALTAVFLGLSFLPLGTMADWSLFIGIASAMSTVLASGYTLDQIGNTYYDLRRLAG